MIHGIPTQSSDLSIGKEKYGKSIPSLSENTQLEKNPTGDVKTVETTPSDTNSGLVFSGGKANELSVTAGSIVDLLLKDGEGLMKIIAPFFSESGDGLQLEKSGGEILTSLKTLYPQKSILNIRDLILSFSLKSDKPDHEFIPRLLEKSGFLFEKKIFNFLHGEISDAENKDAGKSDSSQRRLTKTPFFDMKSITDSGLQKIAEQDLKASILKLMSDSELKSDTLLHSLKDSSEVIEKFQVLNSHSSESGRYLIPFPVFFNGSLNFGQLFFKLGDTNKGKKQKKQRIIKVSLLLTMSELGHLRADMALLKNEISGMIQVENHEICTFVKKMLPEFKSRLNKQDFHVLKMDCEVAAPEKLGYTVFLDDILQNQDGGLNIVI